MLANHGGRNQTLSPWTVNWTIIYMYEWMTCEEVGSSISTKELIVFTFINIADWPREPRGWGCDSAIVARELCKLLNAAANILLQNSGNSCIYTYKVIQSETFTCGLGIHMIPFTTKYYCKYYLFSLKSRIITSAVHSYRFITLLVWYNSLPLHNRIPCTT